MSNYPTLVTERYIVTSEVGNSKTKSQRLRKDGSWGAARPLGYASFRSRLRLGWAVFTGKYDAFEWSE